MSAKLKPNFTPVPNVILDEMMRMLAPGATKVLFAICRFTYGWGKQADRISLSQLQDITGMARGSIARSIKQLGNLVCIKSGNPSRQQASEYRINVEISDVDLVSLCDQGLVSKRDQASLLASLIKRPSKDNQRKRKTGAKAPGALFANGESKSAGDEQLLSDRKLASVSTHSRKKSKPARARQPADMEAFERFYKAYPLHKARAAAERRWQKICPDAALVAKIMAGVARYHEETKDVERKHIAHPATWLNGKRWEDEPAESQTVKEPEFVNA